MSAELTTAIVKIRPEQDTFIIALQPEANSLLDYATRLCIESDDAVRTAGNDLGIIQKLKKAIEEKRLEYTSPINQHLKDINTAFKTFTEPLIQADLITRDKILVYRKLQEKKRQEIDDINRKRQEAAEQEMRLEGELSESVNLIETPTEQPSTYHAGTANIGTSKIWKWKEVDFKLVPDEYKMLDASKIGKVVRAGIRDIPGIAIYSEENLRVTGRE